VNCCCGERTYLWRCIDVLMIIIDYWLLIIRFGCFSNSLLWCHIRSHWPVNVILVCNTYFPHKGINSVCLSVLFCFMSLKIASIFRKFLGNFKPIQTVKRQF
jgi:hypothetical protein